MATLAQVDVAKTLDIARTSADLQSVLIGQLSPQSDLPAMMTKLVDRTAQVLRASACTVFTIDRAGGSATQLAGSGYQAQFNGKHDVKVVPAGVVQEHPEEGEKLGLTGWILSTGKPFLASTPEQLQKHPHHAGRFDTTQLPGRALVLRSFLGVAFRGLRGEIIGSLKAERRLPEPGEPVTEPLEPFSVQDELALETIARVASRCIIYHEMAARGQAAEAITAWARDVIAEAASTEGELDSFLDIAVKVTAAAMRANSCGIFLKDESGKTLTQRAGIGSQALRKVIRAYPWPDETEIRECLGVTHCDPPNCRFKKALEKEDRIGLTAWIATTGKSFHASNLKELSGHCHHLGQYDPINFSGEKTKCGAFLGIPLHVGGSIIGVIKVENTSIDGIVDDRDFVDEAPRRFELLAQDIALAIMRLQSQIPSRYRIIQEAQRTILEILRGGLELSRLANKVVSETRQLFQAGACALFLKEGNRLVQPRWAASGWSERGPQVREYPLVPPEAIKDDPGPEEKVGLTVWIAVKQEKFTAKSNTELTMHPHHKGTFDEVNFDADQRCESFMGFPLLIKEGDKNELVGVLKVETKKRKVDGEEEYIYFNELDEIVFDLIVKSAAIAIQNARLQQAAAAATENAWKQFSAMAAHRTGTEAAVIRGAVRWLKEDLANADVREAEKNLPRISEALNRIDTFVQEFTQFARLPELRLERLNVNELCREVCAYFPAEGLDNVATNLELAVDMPTLWGDREKLLYAFKEMIQNAVKALRGKGGTLNVVTRSMDNGAKIRIEFVDTGMGVPPSMKEKIFEPGFRGRPGGTGLGLAIVQTTVRQHRGTVREVGEYEQGAHFVLELPVTVPEGAMLERILIVDDTMAFRVDLEKIVKWDAPNREVVTASNEHEAAAQLSKGLFDVVITDINLSEAGGSETGGLEVLTAVREKGKTTPVIVVTAYGKMGIPVAGTPGASTITVEEMARRLECFAFIPRPHPGRDYLDVVREQLTQALEHRVDLPGSLQDLVAGRDNPKPVFARCEEGLSGSRCLPGERMPWNFGIVGGD